MPLTTEDKNTLKAFKQIAVQTIAQLERDLNTDLADPKLRKDIERFQRAEEEGYALWPSGTLIASLNPLSFVRGDAPLVVSYKQCFAICTRANLTLLAQKLQDLKEILIEVFNAFADAWKDDRPYYPNNSIWFKQITDWEIMLDAITDCVLPSKRRKKKAARLPKIGLSKYDQDRVFDRWKDFPESKVEFCENERQNHGRPIEVTERIIKNAYERERYRRNKN